MSVAAADDGHVLETVKMVMEAGLITPVLAGDEKKIREIAAGISLALDGPAIIDAPNPGEAALEAVRAVSDGRADILMKGMADTSDSRQAVLDRDCGLRSNKVLSHMAAFQIPGFDRLLFMTDGGINVRPDLEHKRAILENGIDFLLDLGWSEPTVAIITANEVVNPKMPATLDARRSDQDGGKRADPGRPGGWALLAGSRCQQGSCSPQEKRQPGRRQGRPASGAGHRGRQRLRQVADLLRRGADGRGRAGNAGAGHPDLPRLVPPEEKLNSIAMASLAIVGRGKRTHPQSETGWQQKNRTAEEGSGAR